MPREEHYRQAQHLLSDVLGADATNETKAYVDSVEQIARLAELAETYQDHLAAADVVGPSTSAAPNRSRAA
jgi:hypothetical protein